VAWLDIVFMVIFVIAAVKGYTKGFILELFSFIAFFAGLFLAIKLTIPLANMYFDGSDYFYLITIGVFLAVLIGVIFGVNILGKVLKKGVHLTFLGLFDSILGIMASLLKWAFIISVVFWVMDSIGFGFIEDKAADSFVFPWIKNIGPAIFNWFASMLPFIQDMIDSMDDINKKQEELYTFLHSFSYV